MSIPTVTLKNINLLDRICIVDDAPLEIPSILLEDFDIVKKETRGYIYTKPHVIEYYERMFPKMRVRSDDQFDEAKLLDWLKRLKQKEKYQNHKHVLVLDLCCTQYQLSSMFIEKMVEVIHNFGEIIFIMTVPSSFQKHNLFHKFDRIILGQHIPTNNDSDAPLWKTLGEDVRKFYANIARGQKFLSWNVRDGRYEILDVNHHAPILTDTPIVQPKAQKAPRGLAGRNSQKSKFTLEENYGCKDEKGVDSNTCAINKNRPKQTVGGDGGGYENRDECVIC